MCVWLALQTRYEFLEESHLTIWEKLMTKMVTFYFLDLDPLIGKETLLFLTWIIRLQNLFENISGAN